MFNLIGGPHSLFLAWGGGGGGGKDIIKAKLLRV